jgi:hypothetical protein
MTSWLVFKSAHKWLVLKRPMTHIGIRSTTFFVTFLCRRSCAGITMASQVLHVLPRAVVLPRNAAVYELT